MAAKETDQALSSNGEMKVEISFRKISKNAICFHIWKIDEDHIEAEVKGNYGTFVDDGAYIIYASSPAGVFVHQDTLTRELKPNGSLERFIHIWLGEYVNEKKRAFVIQKVQELDSYFGNIATIYRESQSYESSRFLSYFKKGLIIKSSLLINSMDVNRLYQIRGRRCLRCTEMKTISWEHFSAYYIMMLQTAERLYLWFGRSSSNIERRNSIDMAAKYEKDSKNIIIVDDGYEQSLPEQWRNEWNQFLPLNHRVVCQSVSQSEKDSPINMKIYKCCYRNNRLHMDQLDVLKPTKEDLSDSATVYVLDTQINSLWLWVGNLTTQEEKNTALGNGRAFVKKKKYPYYTTITRVVEDCEPIEFKRLFPVWKVDNSESTTSLKSIPTILSRVDSIILLERPKMAAEMQLIDDGSGARQIYRITKDEVLEIPQQKANYFVTHYAYVVAYMVVNTTTTTTTTTINNDADRYQGVERVIYQWNGLEATAEVNAKAEKYARSLFDAAGSKCMLVQMKELDETPHFLQVFRGKLIILLKDKLLPQGVSNNNQNNNNNNNNSYNNSNDNNNNNNIANKNLLTEDKAVKANMFSNSTFMLKVTGDSTYNTKAVEISNLNVLQSKDCYVVNSNGVWVWCGQFSTGDTREMAKNVGLTLGESTLVLEHKEPEEFWQSIRLISSNFERREQTNGSSCNAAVTSTTSQLSASSNSPTNSKIFLNGLMKNPFDIQLFLVWTQRGKHFTQDIVGFEQSDLSPECVYILDANRITYIWLGSNAHIYEKERYMSMVQTYLERIASQRKPSSAIAVIRQHDEPNIFKGFFNSWNNDYWDSYINYETKRQLMSNTACDMYSSGNLNNQRESPQLNGSKMLPVLLNNQKDFDRHQKFPIHILQQEIDCLPPDINPLKREVHLTHDDFVSLFKISYWEFEELPNWKKQELKKKHKLF